ncbi:hypothetical protein ASF06_07565 [Agreia sp. Leaf244]|uniref:hypothetical protein n=1 Tax=Agreia sp. Leaf244 TaxID=1736305 RepID=UPI0006FBD989|nr:hypothetical protein [Agreia sp. Leaf244]KQO10066.1 hypothetical protein ASF06_07565 [Agreia sp. Leaf244]
MIRRSWKNAAAAAALGTALVVTLSGCGTAPWAAGETSAATSTKTSTPTPKATITSIVNELATGSAQHQLQAGDAALTANYWSTLSMDQWTAEANKPISFSLIAALGTDQGQGVYLSRVSVVVAVAGPKGSLEAPAPLSDQASVTPGYDIKSPYSYSQTFILPAVDPAATSVTLSFTYELLIQTTPTSGTYAKQTASDQVTIAIAE